MRTPGGLRRNRDFLYLWAGQTVSTLGSQTCALAFPLLALATTGSPAQAGVLGFAVGLPALALQLPAGALVDRWNRRAVMIRCDIGRMLLMLSIPVTGLVGPLGFGQLVLTATLHAALSVLFTLAQAAAVPQLVGKADLPRAVTLNQTGNQATTLAGQPLGGWLFAVAPVLPFAANAVSYAVSLLTLLGIRSDLRTGRELDRRRRSLGRDVAEGLSYVRHQPLLRALALLSAASTLISGGFTLVLVVLLQGLGSSPSQIGVIFGLCGAAGLAGAAATPWVLRRVGDARLYVGALGASGLLAASLAVAPSTWHAGLAAAAVVGLGPPAAVVLHVARARSIPTHLFARVRSVETTVASSTAPIASLLSGLALSRLGPYTTCALIGTGLLLVAAAAAAVPAVRRMSLDDDDGDDGALTERFAAVETALATDDTMRLPRITALDTTPITPIR